MATKLCWRKHAQATGFLFLCALYLVGCTQGEAVLFLSRPGNGGTGSAEETARYYATIGAEPTLLQWMQNRCFAEMGAQVREAFYYNGADLGLGREIACVECPAGGPKAGLISCTVSNHGVPQGLDQYAFDFADGSRKDVKRDRKASIQFALQGVETFVAERQAKKQLTGLGLQDKFLRGASVVFDFDPKRAESDGKVRMYIYDANTPLLFSAENRGREPEALITGLQLDGEGEALNARVKYMRNCLTCHGGKWVSRGGQEFIVGASFLDFDAVLFNYSDDADPAIGLGAAAKLAKCAPNLDKFDQLHVLLRRVVEGTGATALLERIEANVKNRYFIKVDPRTGACAPQGDMSFVPADWKGKGVVATLKTKQADGSERIEEISAEKYFKTVVHKYCASCHFSQTQGNNLHGRNGIPITFATVEQWFKNENILDLDKLRETEPRATSLDLIRHEVCGASDMPHAEVTRNNMKRDALAFAYVCHAEPTLR